MKEVTAEKWDYRPRNMYVWDDSSDPKKTMYVLTILQSDKKHPVNTPVVAAGKLGWPVFFRHCAELEKEEGEK